MRYIHVQRTTAAHERMSLPKNSCAHWYERLPLELHTQSPEVALHLLPVLLVGPKLQVPHLGLPNLLERDAGFAKEV